MSEDVLTEEDRRCIEQAVFRLDTEDFAEERAAIAKLLRAHDRLERALMDSYDDNRTLRARNRELEDI